jgi:hypothetical protein
MNQKGTSWIPPLVTLDWLPTNISIIQANYSTAQSRNGRTFQALQNCELFLADGLIVFTDARSYEL